MIHMSYDHRVTTGKLARPIDGNRWVATHGWTVQGARFTRNHYFKTEKQALAWKAKELASHIPTVAK